jgi:hypothetical protein
MDPVANPFGCVSYLNLSPDSLPLTANIPDFPERQVQTATV